jgi:hypothetical protein
VEGSIVSQQSPSRDRRKPLLLLSLLLPLGSLLSLPEPSHTRDGGGPARPQFAAAASGAHPG